MNLKDLYINYFISKGHKQIPSAPVVPENDASVLFNTAGMQPLIPYLMGERHPYGKRLCDMGLDDSIIAKLLGHANTSSVKHYRRMASKVLAEGTKKLREEKDKTINKYKGGWN